MTASTDVPSAPRGSSGRTVVAVGLARGHTDVAIALETPGAVAAARLSDDGPAAWWPPPTRRGHRAAANADALASFIGGDGIVWMAPEPVAADAVSGLSTLALPQAALDLWSLATLLFATIGRGERRRLGQALGVALPDSPPKRARAAVEETTRLYEALVRHVDTLDVRLLEEAVRLLGPTDTAEGAFLQAALQRGARRAFTAAGATEVRPTGRGDPTDLLADLTPHPPPLRPSSRPRPLDPAAVVHELGPQGSLAQALPDYEDRPGQRQMAQAVAEALNQRNHVLVEAGTGTGKSLAYLVPAVLYAAANGRRVVVSTNTINLQTQLLEKDAPLLQRALPVSFRAAVAKGRTNYLCLRRWRSLLRDARLATSERFFATRLLFWLEQTRTGDRQELALPADEAGYWATVAADVESCTPQLCRYHRMGVCFLARARRDMEAAHIVITNHALLLADVKLENKVLPPYDDLIIDEAHHLEAEATEQLGLHLEQHALQGLLQRMSQRIGEGRYAGLVGQVQSLLVATGGPGLRERAGALTQPAHDAVAAAAPQVRDLFDAVLRFARDTGAADTGGTEQQIRLTSANRRNPSWERVEESWTVLADGLSNLERAIARLHDQLADFRGASEDIDDALSDLQGAGREVREARTQLAAIIASPQDDTIYWLSLNPRGVALRAAPLDVGALLQQQLFSACDCVVLTSATLQVGRSFRYVLARLGLETDTATLDVPSPFDFRQQALLCVAGDLPPPSTPMYADAVHAALVDVCRITGGQTLILFTSHAALRAAYLALRQQVREVTILGQGIDGPRPQLLERFRTTPGAVLLGTSSFWEGIDVLGEALTCLVIVKLPFTVPTDPVFAARSELYEQPFMAYAVPQAVLRLKQGFGRLIRSTTDRGVVVILDSRVVTRRYGQVFLRSLPRAEMRRCRRAELPTLVARWLNRAATPVLSRRDRQPSARIAASPPAPSPSGGMARGPGVRPHRR